MAKSNLTARTDTGTGKKYFPLGSPERPYYDINATAGRGSQTFNIPAAAKETQNENRTDDQQNNTGGAGNSGGGGGYYRAAAPSNSAVDAINALLQGQMSVYSSEADRARAAFEASDARLKQDLADKQRELYIARMESERTLPQILQYSGRNGGLAESTAAELKNNYLNERGLNDRGYMNNRAALEQSYNDRLADINAKMTLAKAQAEADRINALAKAASSYRSGGAGGSGGTQTPTVDYGQYRASGNTNREGYANTWLNLINSGLSNAEIAAGMNALGLPNLNYTDMFTEDMKYIPILTGGGAR